MIVAVAVRVGESGLGLAVDQFLADAAVGDQLFDRDDRQVESFGQSAKSSSRVARSPVFVEDFAERPRRG